MAVPRGASRILDQERGLLSERDAAAVLSAFGVPFPEGVVVHSEEDAEAAVAHVGPPAVMKIVSRDILHKSDVGGVRLGVRKADARASFRSLVRRVTKAVPEAAVEGILVQHQERPGTEVIVGAIRDRQFGHAVMFGLGGVYAEWIDDVAFRLAPLSWDEANEMVAGTRAARLLRGLRGGAATNTESLAGILVAVSRLVETYPAVAELDLNPVIVRADGAVAVDAVIRLEALPAQSGNPA